MNPKQLKAAARESLRGASVSPTRLTLYLVLLLNGLQAILLVADYFSGKCFGTGLGAIVMQKQYSFFSYSFGAILSLLSVVCETNYHSYALKLSRHEETSIRDFLDPFARAAAVLALIFLRFFYTYLWTLLLVVPGILAFYRYRAAKFLIFDETCPASQALRRSGNVMYGHKTEWFLLDLSFFWFYLPLFVPSVVLTLYLYSFISMTDLELFLFQLVTLFLQGALLIWKLPFVMTTYAHAYDAITQDAGSLPDNMPV